LHGDRRGHRGQNDEINQERQRVVGAARIESLIDAEDFPPNTLIAEKPDGGTENHASLPQPLCSAQGLEAPFLFGCSIAFNVGSFEPR
jgi:hypothetical protein